MLLKTNALPVSAQVKQATQQGHAEVEGLLMTRLAALQSADDYAVILKMFYGYFSPLEMCIRRHLTPAVLDDVEQRRKAGLLLTDLAALGYAGNSLPLCLHLPRIHNTAQAFGALYVLEGSTLGGKVISRMLLNTDVLADRHDALHFFSGYKEETGNRWKTFLAALNRQAKAAVIAETAQATFIHLKSWMEQELVHENNSKL